MALESLYNVKGAAYFGMERVEIAPLLPNKLGRVLDVGCGDGATLQWIRRNFSTSFLTGLEPHYNSASAAVARADKIINLPIESALAGDSIEQFDTLICLDVLEHLENPWEVLRKLFDRGSAGARFVISVPNIRYIEVLIALVLKGKFEYTNMGVLDKTHLRFFTKDSLRELITAAGGRVEHLYVHPATLGRKHQFLSWIFANRFRDVFGWQILASGSVAKC